MSQQLGPVRAASPSRRRGSSMSYKSREKKRKKRAAMKDVRSKHGEEM